jgi:hypothetical protein
MAWASLARVQEHSQTISNSLNESPMERTDVTTTAFTRFHGFSIGVISNHYAKKFVLVSAPPTASLIICLLGNLVLTGCGGGSGSGSPPPPPSTITSVTVSPAAIQLATGSSQLFTAQVSGTGSFNASVDWSVNGVDGGDSVHGTIVGGQYTAPASPPDPSTVTITATSVQDSTKSGSSMVTIYVVRHFRWARTWADTIASVSAGIVALIVDPFLDRLPAIGRIAGTETAAQTADRLVHYGLDGMIHRTEGSEWAIRKLLKNDSLLSGRVFSYQEADILSTN